MNALLNHSVMQSIADNIHSFTYRLGKLVSWAAFFMVLLSCTVVVMRYLFNNSPILLQEAVMYLHGALFMLGASYAWQQDAHVRVDVFYRNWSPSQQLLLNRLGSLFLLLPTCSFLLWVSWDYAAMAWRIGEKSQEAGGLPFVYLQKSLIVAMPILMILQSIAQFIQPTSKYCEMHTDNEQGE